MKSKILKLEPFYSKKIWGYEQWLLSTHKNGKSRIENIDIDNEAELFDTQYNEEKVNDEIEKSRKYLRKVLNKQCKKD